MKKTLVLLAAVIPLLGQDCIGFKYEITMEPKDDGFQRTVRVDPEAGQGKDRNRSGGPTRAEEEIRRLAGVYGRPAPKGDRVTGRFTLRTPSDVGGAGFYKRLDSPLGSVWGYIERVRGNDDLVSQIERIRKGAGEITDALSGWFRGELGRSPQSDKLCAFIDGPFRRDIENAALYLWAGKFAWEHDSPYKDQAGQDLLARLTVYVLERGYIRVDDVPGVARALTGEKESGFLLKLVQRLVASKMGIPDDRPIPKSLAFLSDLKTVDKSFSAYLAGTEKYKQLLEEHRRKKDKQDQDVKEPDPSEVLSEAGLAVAVPLWGMLKTNDSVELSLLTAVKPLMHNGKWDPKSGRVTWSCMVRQKPNQQWQLSAVFWAVWDKPNEQFQTKHFGKVVLSGRKLGEYCIWYNGLTAAEAAKWDAFVSALKPGDNPASKAEGVFARDDGSRYLRKGLDMLNAQSKKDQ